MKKLIIYILFLYSLSYSAEFIFISADSDTVAYNIGSIQFWGDSGVVVFDTDTSAIDTGRWIIPNWLAFLDSTRLGLFGYAALDSMLSPLHFYKDTLWYVRQYGLYTDSLQWKLVDSAGLDSALSDNTGTGYSVFSNLPTFDDSLCLGATGVLITTDNDGAIQINGIGDGNDEDIRFNFDDAVANSVELNSTSGLTKIYSSTIGYESPYYQTTRAIFQDSIISMEDANGGLLLLGGTNTIDGASLQFYGDNIPLVPGNMQIIYGSMEKKLNAKFKVIQLKNYAATTVIEADSFNNVTMGGDITVTGADVTIGATGVKLTSDNDGAITFLGLGNGFDEDLRWNFDDGDENSVALTSTTGLTKIDAGSIYFEGNFSSSDGTAGADATTGGFTFKDGLYTAGTLTETGDIEGITAGAGLSGGATSGTATITVNAGLGIQTTNDSVGVKLRTDSGLSKLDAGLALGTPGTSTNATSNAVSGASHTHAITGFLTGNETITLSGDVTGSGATSISTTIADNSVDGTDIALGSDAQGDIMYYDGTNWARLAVGTSGYLLKTQGAGANPAWTGTIGTGITWNGNKIDISDYTNLGGTDPITVSGDNVGIAAKYKEIQIQCTAMQGDSLDELLTTSDGFPPYTITAIEMKSHSGGSLNDYYYQTFLPQDYKDGTNIYFVARFYTKATSSDDFLIENAFTWCDVDEQIQELTAYGSDILRTASMTTHYYYAQKSASVNGSGMKKGSFIGGYFLRKYDDASDTFDGSVYLISLGIMYQSDNFGVTSAPY